MKIDRTEWPFSMAPRDVDDWDAAVWHAVRKSSAGALPVQSLDQRVRRQRASRDVWEWKDPEPLTETEHEQLRTDLVAAWREIGAPRSARPIFTGRLPR